MWKRDMRGVRLGIVVVGLAAGLGVLLWLRKPERTEIRNVVLVSLDTTRADYLGCYGHAGAITPNIDALAAEGALFERVVAPAPLTLPSHATMLTGTIPPHHGIRDNLFLGLDPSIETLAETLRGRGFVTGAVVSAVVLHRIYGLDQGFDSYDDGLGDGAGLEPAAEQTGDVTTAKAIEWIKSHGEERFFLFLHYFDPHDEYAPPEPFASRFPGEPYAGEIAFTDHCVGEVIAALKSRGLYESTLIVVVGDHGEMLGSHGEASHGMFVYEPAVRVPLIVRPPGARATRRIAANAGVVDVTPTICGLLGIDPPSPGQGRDLSPLLRGGETPGDGRFVYCESLTATKYGANGLRALAGARWKYIQTTRPELYDLAADPAEGRNVIAEHPEVAERLRDRLAEIVADAGGGAAPVSPDEQTLARLRSLGYVSGVVETGAGAGPDADRDDPKDLVELHGRFSEVEVLIARGRLDRAASICEELAGARPQVPLLHQALGRIALARGRPDDAVRHCRAALALDEEQFTAARTLGEALAALGRADEAIEAYRRAVAIRPNEPRAHYQLAHLLYRSGDLDAALEHAGESARLNPDVPAVHTALGRMHMEQGRRSEAIEDFTRALELRPGYPPYLELLEQAKRP